MKQVDDDLGSLCPKLCLPTLYKPCPRACSKCSLQPMRSAKLWTLPESTALPPSTMLHDKKTNLQRGGFMGQRLQEMNATNHDE